MNRLLFTLSLCLIFAGSAGSAKDSQVVWRFDDLRKVGGFTVEAEGDPRIGRGPNGKAVHFDGEDDSILIRGRPLVGAARFTAEVVFRPEGGQFEQRFMHIAETDPATGLDTQPRPSGGDPNPRMMFEIRVDGDSWYLDTFISSRSGGKPLIVPARKHPLGRWYAVAQSYDGTTYRIYVDGVLEAEAPVAFTPHGAGRVRVGARMNKLSHFRGSIALARFTDHALAPAQLLRAAN